MINITKIAIADNLSTDYLLVKWEIGDTAEDLALYAFNVHRSLSPDGGYEIIAYGITLFEYKDYTVDLYDSSIRYYYKIEVVNASAGLNELSADYGQIMYSPPDNVANAIIYHEEMLLKLGDNPMVYALIKRRFGARCPVCWDPIQKKTTKSQCTACYQISFTGGYLPPSLIRMSFTPTERQERMAVEGVKDVDGVVSAWTGNYPVLQPGDIIVDTLNARYDVVSVVPSTKRRYVTHQVLALRKIPPTGIIYKLPLPQFGEVDYLW